MPVQYTQMMGEVGLLLTTHPQFSAQFDWIAGQVAAQFNNTVNSYGAPIGTPHYAGATVVPLTDTMRQLQVGGYASDPFAVGSIFYSKLVGLGEWLMQIMTPKQSRFGNLRKIVIYGDCGNEGHNLMLPMIMGLEVSNPTLSKRLAGAWTAMGSRLDLFYASAGLKIRPNPLTQDPALGDADFPGYMTVMRSAWNTANESAVFVLHGSWCTDHAGYQRGSPSIYLLGTPVCTSFGSMYSPEILGPWVSASTYIPVSELSFVWNTATDLNPSCGTHNAHFSDTYTYVPTTNRVDLTCTFSVSGWVRHLTYYRDVLSQPIVRLRDSTRRASWSSLCT